MIKKRFRKAAALFMMLCMMLSMFISTAFAESAADISNHWAKTTIQSWLDQGFILGYLDGSFKADNNITRAEFMTLVNRAFGYTETTPIVFSDVDEGSWYYSEVSIAKAVGYIIGYPNQIVRPNSPISREEAATIIMRIKNLEADEDAANVFTDVSKLTWSKGAVGAVADAKIMIGYPDGSFGPQKLIKRGECVISLDRATKLEQETVTTSEPAITVNDDRNTTAGMSGGATNAEILADAKVTAHGVLTTALASYTQTDYTPANWITLTEFKTNGDTAIDLATDLTQVISAQTTATAGMSGGATNAEILADAKVTAHGVLTTALASYTQTDYTPANWITLTEFKTNGDTAIDLATDLTQVISAQTTATAGMSGGATNAEILADAKVTAHGVLTTALASYTQTDYTPANWITLTEFKTNGDTAIDLATDLTQVVSAQTTATAGMSGVATNVEILADAKVTAHGVLTTALASYTQTDYTPANWITLTEFKTNGDTAIDLATDLTQVISAQTTATAGMSGGATNAEILADAKVTAHGVLTTALASYTQTDYTPANWITLTEFKTNGDTAIDLATDLTQVISAQTTATAGMSGVATNAEILADAEAALIISKASVPADYETVYTYATLLPVTNAIAMPEDTILEIINKTIAIDTTVAALEVKTDETITAAVTTVNGEEYTDLTITGAVTASASATFTNVVFNGAVTVSTVPSTFIHCTFNAGVTNTSGDSFYTNSTFNGLVTNTAGNANYTGSTFAKAVTNTAGNANYTGSTFDGLVTNTAGDANYTGSTFNDTVNNVSGNANYTDAIFNSQVTNTDGDAIYLGSIFNSTFTVVLGTPVLSETSDITLILTTPTGGDNTIEVGGATKTGNVNVVNSTTSVVITVTKLARQNILIGGTASLDSGSTDTASIYLVDTSSVSTGGSKVFTLTVSEIGKTNILYTVTVVVATP